MRSLNRSFSRRNFLRGAVGLGAVTAMPSLLAACGREVELSEAEQEMLAPYQEASIDWRQVEGTTITVLDTPAHYFGKFRAFTNNFFNALTGIDVRFETIPPRELREKAVLDLGARSAQYATHTGDPMYLPLYESSKWVDPLSDYLNDSSLTDQAWFNLEDIIPAWREANTVNGELYGMPVEGEATIHIYRADVYQDLGLEPPETLEELSQTAEQAHSADLSGLALRGFLGAGQNMYIFPSLFKAFGGEWFDADGNPTVNSEAGVSALQYYVENLQSYAPSGVENMNWPEIMEAFASGGLAQYIDANSTASVIENPAESNVAGEVGYQRWPKGPSGKRVSSIWNWAMPINAALSEEEKKATWLYLQFLASQPTQLESATYEETEDAEVRTGVNRISIWEDPDYREAISFTEDYVDVVLTSLEEDTDPDWRPRVPEWPDLGEAVAIVVQEALTNQKSPEQALDEANAEITRIMEG